MRATIVVLYFLAVLECVVSSAPEVYQWPVQMLSYVVVEIILNHSRVFQPIKHVALVT